MKGMLDMQADRKLSSYSQDVDIKHLPPQGSVAGTLGEEIFPQLMSSRDSNQEMHAVFQATSDVLRQHGAQLTPAAYFASLVTALSRVTSSDGKTAAAVLALLATCIPQVPRIILVEKFSQTVKALSSLLEQNKEQPVLRLAITCVFLVLEPQPRKVFKSREVQILFESLLEFMVDPKPKIRKRARESLIRLFQNVKESIRKVLSKYVVKLCVTHFQKITPRDYKHALQLLQLSEPILPLMTEKACVHMCQELVKLPSLNHAILSSSTFMALERLFSSDHVPMAPEKLCALVEAIPKLEPRQSDEMPTQYFVQCLTAGILKMAEVDHQMSVQFLHQHVEMLCSKFACQDLLTIQAVTRGLKTLFSQLLTPQVVEAQDPVLPTISGCLEHCLGYQYQSTWGFVLDVTAAFLRTVGSGCKSYCADLVLIMDQLIRVPQFKFQKQVEKALGMVMEAVGPEDVLDLLPLNLIDDTPQQPSRQWLIEVMTKHVCGARIQYFATNILPLARQVLEKSQQLADAGFEVEAKNLDTKMLQLWGLLPVFANEAQDVSTAMVPDFAKTLGQALEARLNLRRPICKALMIMITQNRQRMENLDASVEEKRAAQESLATLSRYSGNFLPILFNLATEESFALARQPLLEAIEAYAGISDAKLVDKYFKTILQRLLKLVALDSESATGSSQGEAMDHDAGEAGASSSSSSSGGGKKKRSQKEHELHKIRVQKEFSLLELLMSLLPGVSQESVPLLHRTVRPLLQDADMHLQKKAYQVLRRICEYFMDYVLQHLDELQQDILDSLVSCAPPAKKPRIRTLGFLIAHLPRERLFDFYSSIITEVVLCLKDPNSKSRLAAYDLLVTMAHTAVGSPNGPVDPHDLNELLQLVIACLGAETPHMLSATILALSRLIFEYRAKIGTMVSDILPPIFGLLEHPSREVLKSTLGFIQVVLKSLPVHMTIPHLPDLISKLLPWTDRGSCPGTTRVRIKNLFEKFIRKFGLEEVDKFMPQEAKSLLKNVRKIAERDKRKKEEKRSQQLEIKNNNKSKGRVNRHKEYEDAFADSSDDEDEGPVTKSRKRIKELLPTLTDAPDLDLLDPTNSLSRRHSGPKSATAESDDEEGDGLDDIISFDKSGRLVVGMKGNQLEDSDEDMEEDEDAEKSRTSKGGKQRVLAGRRRNRMSDDEDEDMSEEKSKVIKRRKAEQKKAADQKRRERMGVDDIKHTGAEYRPKTKRAKGDVKVEGRPDPFAYVPLNAKFTNKRNKGKALRRYETMAKPGTPRASMTRTQKKARDRHK